MSQGLKLLYFVKLYTFYIIFTPRCELSNLVTISNGCNNDFYNIYYSFTMNRQIYKQWMLLQENIGVAKLWPQKIRRLFWCHSPKHWDRVMLSSFVVINGLDPEIMADWIKLMGWSQQQIYHFMSLITKYMLKRNYKMYSFHVGMGKYLHLDMSTHYYNRYCGGCSRNRDV